MKNRKVSALLIFGISVAAGVYAGRTSWNGAIYLTSTSFTSNLRNPAAVHRDLDDTKLEGSELITGTKNRLVSEAKVLRQPGELGLEFGHFVTRDESGNRQLACDFFNRMRIRFEAEGVASAGEKPTMEIEGPCKTGEDITKIEPVWIPVMKILAEKPTDMDLSFPESEGLAFKFSNIDGEWPSRWILSSVELLNDAQSGRVITFDSYALHAVRAKPLVLAWPSSDRMPTSDKKK
jgi:hypothetical protein